MCVWGGGDARVCMCVRACMHVGVYSCHPMPHTRTCGSHAPYLFNRPPLHAPYNHHVTQAWVGTARRVLGSLEQELGETEGPMDLHLDGPAAVIHDAVSSHAKRRVFFLGGGGGIVCVCGLYCACVSLCVRRSVGRGCCVHINSYPSTNQPTNPLSPPQPTKLPPPQNTKQHRSAPSSTPSPP